MQAVNKVRQARKRICKNLGITNKQLKKRKILRQYEYFEGYYVPILGKGGQHAAV